MLEGVDIDVRRGEVVALLGPNGAGKTTLLKLLAGLQVPARGSIRVRAGSVGWVPQGGGVHGRLTVRENLELFAQLQRMPRETATDALQAAGLDPWSDTTAEQLSGGLRQRLNVAVGLLGSPEAILLDEPTTGIDLEHRALLAALLRAHADAGGAVLHTTHDVEDARVADRVVVLVDGCVVFDGAVDGLAGLSPDVQLPHRYDAITDPVTRGLLRAWAEGHH